MRSTKHKLAWAATTLALTAGLIGVPGCFRKEPAAQDKPSPPATAHQAVRVKVIAATRQLSIPQPAQVGAYEKTDIYAKITGYVQSLGPALAPGGKPILDKGKARALDIGDPVGEGQVLARLWVPEIEKELELKRALAKQAEADVAKYEAEKVFREAELDRLEKMVKDKSIQEAVRDEKRFQRDAVLAAIGSAKARVQVALREVEYVQAMLEYASIKAPYEGVITRRLVDTGAFVQSSKPEPLFTVARVDRLRIIAEIPEAEARLVRIEHGATFQLNAAPGQAMTGKVVRFAGALDAGTRTLRTEVELDEKPTGLRPGMFGSLTIGPIMLPKSALLPDAKKPAVLVVEQGKARRREVELGPEDGGRVEVLRGLSGGEQVISDGKTPVRDGEAVEIIP
jgi:RND family efflux transporter MFP subunit